MAALRPLARLALVLLCMLPTAAAADSDPRAALIVEPGSAEVLVTLTCPEPAPALAVAIDNTPVVPLAEEALGEAPPSLALVIDVSAPMEAAGTPHSTRLRDAVTRAELLLAMAPPGAAMALVAFDHSARVSLPMSVDRAAVRAALADLRAAAPVPAAEPGPATEPPLYALPEAISLGLSQLQRAQPGPRALVAFVAGTPELEPVDATAPPGVGMLVVGQGADLPPGAEVEPGPLARFAEGLGAAYAPFHSLDIASLPALNRALERHFARLLTPGARLRLRLPAADLVAGAHLLSVEGCGTRKVAAFETPHGPELGAVALGVTLALAAVAAGAGVSTMWRRRRAHRAVAPPVDTPTARLRAAAEITTARRSAMPAAEPRLHAVMWDGRRRWLLPLEGRQWTVGSDPACAICVEGEGVAALHARVSLAGNRLEITALAGGGRTCVGRDGRPLTPGAPEPLEPGDLVMIGQATRLVIESAVERASPEDQ